MSERGTEPDIEPHCVNVAEVPTADIGPTVRGTRIDPSQVTHSERALMPSFKWQERENPLCIRRNRAAEERQSGNPFKFGLFAELDSISNVLDQIDFLARDAGVAAS
jgi:hypothetical protein